MTSDLTVPAGVVLINEGYFIVSSLARFTNLGTVVNSGTFQNAGGFDNYGYLNNSGTFANDGNFSNVGTGTGTTCSNAGCWPFVGEGAVCNSGGVFENDPAGADTGTINNTGVIGDPATGFYDHTSGTRYFGPSATPACGAAWEAPYLNQCDAAVCCFGWMCSGSAEIAVAASPPLVGGFGSDGVQCCGCDCKNGACC